MWPKIVAEMSLLPSTFEVIFVDGGSRDGSMDLLPGILLPTTVQQRAARMNLGLQRATGDWVVFHHPRTFLHLEAWEVLLAQTVPCWGGWTHQFDVSHPLLRFTSWYSNHVRFPRGIVYLDHCLFAPRSWLLEIGGVPEVDVFEDTLLSRQLRARYGMPRRLDVTVTTSAVRFTEAGLLRHSLRNQWLKLMFYAGWHHQRLNRQYEGQLELNGKTGPT